MFWYIQTFYVIISLLFKLYSAATTFDTTNFSKLSSNFLQQNLSQPQTMEEYIPIGNFTSIYYYNATLLRVSKCCPHPDMHGLVMSDDVVNWSCIIDDEEVDNKFALEIFKKPYDLNSTGLLEEFFPISGGIPNCSNKLHSLINGEEIWFRVLESGEIVVGLHFWFWPLWLPVARDEYCIDELHGKSHKVLLFCSLDGYDNYIIHKSICCGAFIFSAICLLLAFIIYRIAQPTLNFHTLLQLSYFMANFLFYATDGVRQYLKLDGLNIKTGVVCFYHSVSVQYFFFAVSSTVMVLGFDMLWNFWKMRPVYSKSESNKKRVIKWIVIPWTIPLIILTAGLIYNHFTNPEAIKQEIGLFKFGHYRCASPLFFVGSMTQSVLFILNIIYFILTGFAILKTAYVSKFATQESARKFTSDSFHLLIKISMIQGCFMVGSIFEFLLGESDPLAWHWVLNRTANLGLQGFWLLIAFGFTTRNRTQLIRRFGFLQRCITEKNRIFGTITKSTNSSTAESKLSRTRSDLQQKVLLHNQDNQL